MNRPDAPPPKEPNFLSSFYSIEDYRILDYIRHLPTAYHYAFGQKKRTFNDYQEASVVI